VPLCAHAVVPASITTSALATAKDFECMMISLAAEALHVQNALSVVRVPWQRAAMGDSSVAAKSNGPWLKADPGYRFAHPGYDTRCGPCGAIFPVDDIVREPKRFLLPAGLLFRQASLASSRALMSNVSRRGDL
jgi:hypothetical protein